MSKITLTELNSTIACALIRVQHVSIHTATDITTNSVGAVMITNSPINLTFIFICEVHKPNADNYTCHVQKYARDYIFILNFNVTFKSERYFSKKLFSEIS